MKQRFPFTILKNMFNGKASKSSHADNGNADEPLPLSSDGDAEYYTNSLNYPIDIQNDFTTERVDKVEENSFYDADEAMKDAVIERRSSDNLSIIAITHTGRVRPANQDVYILSGGLFGVADGMGGHKGGETASNGAKDRLQAILHGKTPSVETLESAVEAVNRKIYAQAQDDSSLTGMGTTLTVAWADNVNVYIAHVGDSRAYLYRNGELRQVTTDHSLVGEMVKNGTLTPEQAERHPLRNIITRALGTEDTVDTDCITEKRYAGDVWLLCSDGLYSMIGHKRIAEIMSQHSPNEAAPLMVKESLIAGGKDNITLVMVQDGMVDK